MRVIAGQYRSRVLQAPRGSATRPTSDRLRETLFNILAPRVVGCRFADLYAGSGAVGIEALSRGAAHVLFAEKAPPAAAAIRTNAAALKILSGVAVEERSVAAVLDRMLQAREQDPAWGAFDLMFLDPPWEAAAEYSATLGYLGSAKGARLLAPGGLVIAEHAARTGLAPKYGSLVLTRTLKQGDAALTFYAQCAASPHLDDTAAAPPPRSGLTGSSA